MSAAGAAVAGAVTFTWLGMVLAISFLEAPLKFRAPGVSVPVGLGIGRLVFRALNLVEIILVVIVITVVGVDGSSRAIGGLTTMLAVLLAVQLGVVRPRLNRRSERVLAGENLPRSHGHLYYVGLEVAKVLVLTSLGIGVLSVR